MASPVCARKGAYYVDLVKDEAYFWCTCGRSRKQPFCDGSHEGSDFRPWRFVALADGRVAMCGCKQTGSSPFCDGTHADLGD